MVSAKKLKQRAVKGNRTRTTLKEVKQLLEYSADIGLQNANFWVTDKIAKKIVPRLKKAGIDVWATEKTNDEILIEVEWF